MKTGLFLAEQAGFMEGSQLYSISYKLLPTQRKAGD